MLRFWWTLRCAWWLKKYGYCRTLASAYRYAQDECWQEMRDDGFTPKGAVEEDVTYG